MTAAAAEDRDRVGPYRVIQAIGAGGSARIDLARIDRAYGFQRHVVLKRPLEHLRGDPAVAASLRREARIGGLLRHPNLVAILDAGVHDGYDYLVLEYVHGAALRAVMQTETPGKVRDLPLGVALAIVCDAARGMHEAHELTDDRGSPLGLVHRDVSPGNILLGLDGTVKLADFGIAKETRVSTLSGSMHGTVTYMAPEQCQGHAFDRRADVFSLGVILYELVTGARLFWADNDVASLHRVLSGVVPRPRKIKPQIPGALEDVVMTAIAHDPERRFASALELAGAVEHHAASAGEVLGARWIARAVEAVVGPRPVPWIAVAPEAAPVREATPPSGSLIDLLAATGPDEPVETTFGESGDAEDGGEEASAEAPPAAAPPRSAVPATRRRGRALAAGIFALAVIGGAAIAGLGTRRSDAPSAAAPPPAGPAGDPRPVGAVEGPREAADRAAASPATTAAPAAAPAAAGVDSPARDPGDAPAPTDPTAQDTAAAAGDPRAVRGAAGGPAPPHRPEHAISPPATAGKRRSHPPARPREPVPVPSEPARSETAAAPPAATASEAGTGSGSAQPSTRPTKVEWKPTMLWPTEGSRGSGSGRR
ncbi:MAG: hypothetical protein E6J90_07955 [Deltaproteobacteria bacterium]|nr:MAG: hypothetical protein E6J90_07955 [Deltaproteobacteria bacterium]